MTSHTLPRTAPRARTRLRLRVDYLWLVIVLAGIGAFIGLTATPPNDFWWHLKAGQVVATSGIPRTNLFAWTLPTDAPYIYATWLGEYGFFRLYQLGGLGLVVFARNLLGVLGFGLVALEGRRRSGSWRLGALAALLAFAMSANNMIIRTQNWSWLPIGLFALLLGSYAAGQVRGRVLLALPVIMMLWVNSHGAFALGIVLVGLVALGETGRRMFGHGGALSWRGVGWLYVVGALVVAATLANPLGVGIFGYVRLLLSDPSSQGLINEWQPPAPHDLPGVVFYASILLLLVVFAYGRRRPTLSDTLIVLAFLWQAWSGVRYVMWFGMLAMPILVQSLAAPAVAKPRVPAASLLNTALAAMMALLMLLMQPPLVNHLPVPEEYRVHYASVPGAALAFSAGTPVAATAWLRTHAPPSMRLFNEMGYGSYLAWALYPQAQSFIDPRVELFPLAQWHDYINITKAVEYDALLRRYGVTHAMIDREAQPALCAALANDAAWRQVYGDAATLIFERVR